MSSNQCLEIPIEQIWKIISQEKESAVLFLIGVCILLVIIGGRPLLIKLAKQVKQYYNKQQQQQQQQQQQLDMV